MRRPGNLAGANYWFGEISPKPKKKKSLIDGKLAQIADAKIKNGTPLTEAQRRGKLLDVLNGKKPGNITG
jgi:hypothetical protein